MEFDNIPDGWKIRKIKEIGKVITGKTPKTKIPENFGTEYPFITPTDLIGDKNIYKTERFLSEIGKNSVKNALLPRNSVCVSCIGSDMGKVVKTTRPSITNQQINSIIVNNDNSHEYIYYNLMNRRNELKHIASGGTALPIINKSTFEDLNILIPTLEEQHKIGFILSTFDEKIELNNQMNKNLEQMAQVLFKSWFVDFEPFLDEEFEETELGLIPKNWRVDTLDKIAKINSKSINPASKTFYNHYSLPSFDDYKYPEIVDGETIKSNKTLMNNNTILLSKLNPRFKRLWLNLDIDNEYKNISSTEFVNYEPLEEKYYSYLYFLLDSQYFQDLLNSNATGSTGSRQRVKPKETLDYKVIIPEEEIIIKFHSKISSFIEKIRLNIKENKILEKQRDTLLPKLMTGEIKVGS